jgi:replication factor A1
MPISALNSFSMDWRIKARVLKKPPIRTYKNAKGEGQILTVDLIDRDGTMIQATMFN